jgi:hypothetical protein
VSGMPHKIPEAYRQAARVAVRAGWRIERTTRHLAWTTPTGVRIITPSTPGDRRGYRDDLARLRRAGLPVLHRPRNAKASARRQEAAR